MSGWCLYAAYILLMFILTDIQRLPYQVNGREYHGSLSLVDAYWVLLLSGWVLAIGPRYAQAWRWWTSDDIRGADWIWCREDDEQPWRSPTLVKPLPPPPWRRALIIALW